MVRTLIAILLVLIASTSWAAPVDRNHTFTTGQQCNVQETGRVSLTMDTFGTFGSATTAGGDADFDAGNDDPDLGEAGTVYRSSPFLCQTQAGQSQGEWLANGVANAEADAVNNRMTSDYTVNDVAVDLTVTLECNILTQCWTFTNQSNARIDALAITQYVDGDLFFVGNFGNDYGATSVGIPRTIYEFDAGDNPQEPTTQLALYGTDPNDRFLTGWEIAEYSESERRISNTDNGCEPLRNGITNQEGENTDGNNDRVTDEGYDVTLALRFDTGPLDAGEMSPAICAKSLSAKHSKTLVRAKSYDSFLSRSVKAWPAASGIKLTFTAKQWFITHNTSVDPVASFIPVDAGKRSLRICFLRAFILLVS